MQFYAGSLAQSRLAMRSVVDNADSSDGAMGEPTITALIILLSIVFVGLLLASTLMLLRRMKQQQRLREMALPQYHSSGKPHGLTIQTNVDGRSSLVVYSRDGQPMLANPQSPPYSPDNVPEIRITFPDEQDEMGHCKSGRVVVVRMGETSVGMEPLAEEEEQLPAYEKESKGQFYSINIDEIGGLKEKSDHTRAL